MKRVGFILLGVLLHQSIVYGVPQTKARITKQSQPHVYIMPHINYGALFTSDGMQVSGAVSGQLLCGVHFQYSKKLALTLTGNHFPKYETEDNQLLRSVIWDLIGKYYFYSVKELLSQPINLYGHAGLWYGFSKEAAEELSKDSLSNADNTRTSFQGSGLVVGGGVYYEISKRLMVDVSYKCLLPLMHQDLARAHLVTWGVGIRLL